ncbi:2-dehydropantoate 2-reductase N-terminal domain-containing protein [Georgenia sp. MJ206]|uniref:ketopantoate reductase family protein n=1 Tax=Georgenia wangjunii TaxID=3117730 RepID=UPI002F267AF6
MIAVVGPGAVGGLLAAMLERAGEDVVVVARPASAARVQSEGITVRSAALGEWTSRVRAQEAVPPGAAVVLAVKAYGLDDVLPQLGTARPAEVLALLNGVRHAERLRTAEGLQQVVSGAVSVEAQRTGGAVEHRSPFVSVSVPRGAASWRTVAALERAGVTLRLGGSESQVLWTKLRLLAPIALLTTYWDLPIGAALARDEALAAGIAGEVAALATAAGLPTDADELLTTLRGVQPGLRSSLQHDVAAGRPSELEDIGGVLLALAPAPVPALGRVVEELRQRVVSTSR